MARRPAWSISDHNIIRKDYEFKWNGGFAISQKQKNIVNLHNAIQAVYIDANPLEVSTKSEIELGKKLSAFNLKLGGTYIENIFQSAKKYENGGPYLDLLKVEPKNAKRDERHKTSGKLLCFYYDSISWDLDPKTAFYDYLFLKVASAQFSETDLRKLCEYNWFTDIEFNPSKSINCQARTVAILKLLFSENMFSILDDISKWIEFHKKRVKG